MICRRGCVLNKADSSRDRENLSIFATKSDLSYEATQVIGAKAEVTAISASHHRLRQSTGFGYQGRHERRHRLAGRDDQSDLMDCLRIDDGNRPQAFGEA